MITGTASFNKVPVTALIKDSMKHNMQLTL